MNRSNELLFPLKIDIFMTGKILLARKYLAINSVKQQPDNFIPAGVTTYLNIRAGEYFYKTFHAKSIYTLEQESKEQWLCLKSIVIITFIIETLTII